MQSLSIILPAFNEETRLPRTFALLQDAIAKNVFKNVQLLEIIVVNDGSTDKTLAVVDDFRKKMSLIKLLDINPNQGKGNAIHQGLAASQGDLCLIADADSATPWDQFIHLHAQIAQNSKLKLAIASRDLPGSQVRIQQSWIREHMGRTFNLMVRLITQLPYRDTQCGFKLVTRRDILGFLPFLKVKRFAWDVEFLMFARAHELQIQEVPVIWEHQEESRVHAIRDSLEMLWSILKMRVRIWFTQN